ncbi:MAG: hypothetical protein JHC79_18815, partial [Williamsia sp.]|nr:hypothetical protein [Williamsia sp.]
MPNSVLWVCLVAIWLFVLVPMVIKGRPEVRKRTEATLATRVINRGGRAMSKASSKVARGRHPHDADWVAPVREYRKPGELINELDDHSDVLVADEPEEIDDADEIVADADDHSRDTDEIGPADVVDGADDGELESDDADLDAD